MFLTLSGMEKFRRRFREFCREQADISAESCNMSRSFRKIDGVMKKLCKPGEQLESKHKVKKKEHDIRQTYVQVCMVVS